MDISFKQATCYTKGRLLGLIKPSFFVVHWMAGTLEGTDSTFTNPNLGKDPHLGLARSAHYGLGPTAVHQYVKDTDVAWQAGNWWANLRSIGIEHQGAPWLPIEDATYAHSAQLLADLSVKWHIPLNAKTVVPHKLYNKSTECPGTLVIDRLIADANQLLAPVPVIVPIIEAIIPPPGVSPTPAPTEPHTEFPKTVTVTVYELFVRSEPNTTAPLAGSMRLFKGNTFEAVERVSGESVNGNNQWYKSSLGHFCWTGGCT